MSANKDEASRGVALTDKRAAVQALIAEHGSAVRAHCIRVLRHREDAEDAAQYAFVQAYRDYDRFEARGSARAWLLAIASNRCKDLIKSSGRYRQRIESDDDAVAVHEDVAGGPRDHLERSEELLALEDCLRDLSPETKIAVLLRFRTQLSYEEMARELGVKSDTLQRRVARALPALRACLEGKERGG